MATINRVSKYTMGSSIMPKVYDGGGVHVGWDIVVVVTSGSTRAQATARVLCDVAAYTDMAAFTQLVVQTINENDLVAKADAAMDALLVVGE